MSATEIISGYADVAPEDVALPTAKETASDIIMFHRNETDDEAPEPKARRRMRGGKKTRSPAKKLNDVAVELRAQNEMVLFWANEYTIGTITIDKLIDKLRSISIVIKRLKNTQAQLQRLL